MRITVAFSPLICYTFFLLSDILLAALMVQVCSVYFGSVYQIQCQATVDFDHADNKVTAVGIYSGNVSLPRIFFFFLLRNPEIEVAYTKLHSGIQRQTTTKIVPPSIWCH